MTDQNGAFQFTDVPAGRYQVVAHLDRVPEVVKRIGDQIIDFQLFLAPVREEVIVTASGSAESVDASDQSVNSVGALASRIFVSVCDLYAFSVSFSREPQRQFTCSV